MSILAVRNAMLLLIDGNIRALGGSGNRGLFFCSQPMANALPRGTIGTDPHEWRQDALIDLIPALRLPACSAVNRV